jgi:predicted ATPase/transcriptional regulator with XRE-family HTH domain
MDAETTFGNWLRRRRRALDLTREELAQQVACSAATIRKIEADERRPSKQIAARLADCLGIPPEEQDTFITFARTEPYSTPAPPPPPPVTDPLPWHKPSERVVNLPVPLTRLIGREQTVAAARNYLLRDEARLLTLIGPPGIGKTRLSLQLAASLVEAFPDGVSFVALAPLNDPNLVITTLAHSLGVKERSDQPLHSRLISYLRDKRMLLVLDNFEPLLEAAPLAAQLLEECPGIKMLVTSRAALQIRGEWQFPVPPLLLPDLTNLPVIETLQEYSAVALFIERAQAVNPNFALTQANAASVAAICARLDGLPLAIELAAAWSKLLSPQELLARLSNRLTLLTGGPLDLPARHRTLRAAITSSYDLLEAEEQILLARLAVFSGGCTVAAAEAVVADFGLPILDFGLDAGDESIKNLKPEIQNVLAGLASLVNKSLLLQQEQADGQSRFSMLETIHEYALERLVERGDLETLRQRHAAYYVTVVEAAEPELRRAQQLAWLEQLEREHLNLRAALTWALEDTESELALRLGGTLWRFWELHSHLSEGRKWLTEIVADSDRYLQAQAGPPGRSYLAARAKALNGAGKLANDHGDPVTAQALCEQSLALWQELGPAGEPGRVLTLHHLGLIAQSRGHLDRALELHRACLTLAQQLDDRVGSYLALFALAEVAVAQGDDQQAIHLHEQSLSLKWKQGDIWSIAWSLSSLALLAVNQGDLARATALHQESLKLRWQLGDKWSVAESLAGLAGVAAQTGQPERAARLFGAIGTLLKTIDASLSPLAQTYYDHHLAATRTQMDGASFTTAQALGRAMPLDEIIAYALEKTTPQ